MERIEESPDPAVGSNHARPRRRAGLASLAAGVAAAALAGVGVAQTPRTLADLSIEQLSEIEVTSVSRRPETLARSAASIYVITGEDIRRSGAASLAEALRLAPNLEVARYSSQGYTISARGFNSPNAANKILVLIDGRSIFTPFFNSVFWDQQDVMLDDVERIEVISGPGGTLWGANAVNGVINVITRTSRATQGGVVDARVGTFGERGAVRWGGRLGTDTTLRAYALGFEDGHTRLPGGASARDDWRGAQAGFRADGALAGGELTLQGDAYENVVDAPSARRSGTNLLARWNRRLADGATLEVQAYHDRQNRNELGPVSGSQSERVRTFDVQAEHAFSVGLHQIVWGFGQRQWRDEFVNTVNPFVLDPVGQSVSLTNVYVQDSITVRDDVRMTLGTKFEYSSFSGWDVMPSARVGWQVTDRDFAWAAVSRAVRPPSRLERDLTAPGIVELSPGFRTEKLVAYEAGWRSQLSANANASLSIFYNRYTDLRTTSPGPTYLPVHFGNGLEGHSYGVEAWGSYRPAPWLRLEPGVTLLHKDFHVKPGDADIAGTQTVLGHDPASQWFLRGYVDLPRDAQLYVGLRRVAALSDIGVPAYFEADARVAWQVTPSLELSVTGQNLVHAYHAEANQPPLHEIPRSVVLGARWTFR